MKIQEMYQEERPREKALRVGIEKLSNQELLAIQLGSGFKQSSALELASDILSKNGGYLSLLSSQSIYDLMKHKGIKESKAVRIASCFEIGTRISYEQIEQPLSINAPKSLIRWLNQKIGFSPQETFFALFLDAQNAILSYQTIFLGTLDKSIVHPREIYRKALLCGCSKIICVHNHPSGKCQPSNADHTTTKLLNDIGNLLQIPLLDHIIVGKNNYYSFREQQLLPK